MRRLLATLLGARAKHNPSEYQHVAMMSHKNASDNPNSTSNHTNSTSHALIEQRADVPKRMDTQATHPMDPLPVVEANESLYQARNDVDEYEQRGNSRRLMSRPGKKQNRGHPPLFDSRMRLKPPIVDYYKKWSG